MLSLEQAEHRPSYRYRRSLLQALLVIVGFVFCVLTSAFVLPEPALTFQEKFVSVAAVLGAAGLAIWMLSAPLFVCIDAHGVGLRSVVRMRVVPWASIAAVWWKDLSRRAGAKSILLQTEHRTYLLQDCSFDPGTRPMLAAIRDFFPAGAGTLADVDYVTPAPFGPWAAKLAIAYAVSLVLIGFAGAVGYAPIRPLEAAMYAAGASAAVAGALWAVADDLTKEVRRGVMPLCVLDEASIQTRRAQSQHGFGEWIVDALLRRVFPIKPEFQLTEEELTLVEEHAKRCEAKWNKIAAVVIPLAMAAVMAGLVWLHGLAYPPDPTAVFEARREPVIFFLAAALMCAPLPCIAIITRFLARSGPGDLHLSKCYLSTIKGYDSSKALLLLLAVLFVMGSLMGIAGWGRIDLVNQEGIRFKALLLTVERRGFSEVRAIEIDRAKDPKKWRLRVRFAEGDHFHPQFQLAKAEWERVAQFISERAKVPVTDRSSSY